MKHLFIFACVPFLLYLASATWTPTVKLNEGLAYALAMCTDSNKQTVIAYYNRTTVSIIIIRLTPDNSRIEKQWTLLTGSEHLLGMKVQLFCRQNLANDILLLYYRGIVSNMFFAEASGDIVFERKFYQEMALGADMIFNNDTGRVTIIWAGWSKPEIFFVTRPPDSDEFSEEVSIFTNKPGEGIKTLSSCLSKNAAGDIWNVAIGLSDKIYYMQVSNNGAVWDDPVILATFPKSSYIMGGVAFISNPSISSALFLFFQPDMHNLTYGLWTLDQGASWCRTQKITYGGELYPTSGHMYGTPAEPKIVLRSTWGGNYMILKQWTHDSVNTRDYKSPFDQFPALMPQRNKPELLEGVGHLQWQGLRYSQQQSERVQGDSILGE